ncbi:hypothetical protein CD039_11135 [Staphylococcus argensis]|uniref:Uncharacterized protein n=1 Tax=Staphylococcus argensis TaxID=1607738 RepID=A0A2K4FBH2_9STAP|nr:hypothetical protein [Staphylococcus argensis]POA08613.1 hypothetical protein CD039_11135 [Staphylococcus argensis]
MINYEKTIQNWSEKFFSIRRFILMILITVYIYDKFEMKISNNFISYNEIEMPYFMQTNALMLPLLSIIMNLLLVSIFELLLIFLKEENKKVIKAIYKVFVSLILIQINLTYLGLLKLQTFNAISKDLSHIYDNNILYICLIIAYILLWIITGKLYFKYLGIFYSKKSKKSKYIYT